MATNQDANNSAKKEDTDTNVYLSDESDFYGDEDTKQQYEERAKNFNVDEYWKNRPRSFKEIAAANLEAEKKANVEVAKHHNPYKGLSYARQLNESAEEFIKRLPPSSTSEGDSSPWIYAANPYYKDLRSIKEEGGDAPNGEGPPGENSNWDQLVKEGWEMLDGIPIMGNSIEQERKSQVTANMVKRFLDRAVELHCTSGKWMLFCLNEEVNDVWRQVVRATIENDLGISAKVTPFTGERRASHVICIYTKDFSDTKDIDKIIHKMRSLGLVKTAGKAIYYKCDAYSRLNIHSSNEYGIKASLYSSRDFLKPIAQERKEGKTGEKKSLLYKDKLVTGDWKQLENE